MVVPPALMAAMPVGASTTMRLGDSERSRRRKVVFPVPALPVRNRLVSVVSIIFRANSICGLSIDNVSVCYFVIFLKALRPNALSALMAFTSLQAPTILRRRVQYCCSMRNDFFCSSATSANTR